MRSGRRVSTLLVAVLAGVLIGGAGWALAASKNARPVNPQIVANFAQFRRARTAADVLPAGVPSDRCGPPFEQGGLKWANLQGLEAWYQIQCFRGGPLFAIRHRSRIIAGLQRDQSRAVRLPDHLGTVWLVPSGRWLCNLLQSPFLFGEGKYALACEPIGEVLAHPPLWNGGMWAGPGGRYNGSYLFALEPDRVTHVTVGYAGGIRRTHLAHNVLGACIGGNSLWLNQTGPTINGTITTQLGGGGPPSSHLRKCRYPL